MAPGVAAINKDDKFHTFATCRRRRMISPLPCTLKYTSFTLGAIFVPQKIVFVPGEEFSVGCYFSKISLILES